MSRPAAQSHPSWTSIDHASGTRRHAPAAKHFKRQFIKLPGGNKAVGAFFLSLIAYTLQTETAQYVQQGLNYRKPFLSLYLGHSAFTVLFPMHLALLCYGTKFPLFHYLHLISQNLRWQLRTPSAPLPLQGPDALRRRLSVASGRGAEPDAEGNQVDLEDGNDGSFNARSRHRRSLGEWMEDRIGFNAIKLSGLLGILTLGITIPALSWYSAVPMTSMADITAIYNTFSVWALVFSVCFLGEKWQKRKVFSVLLACIGVVVVAYGGADHRKQPKEVDPVYGKPEAPATGNATAHAAATLITRAVTTTVQDLIMTRADSGDEPPSNSPPSFSNPMLGNLLALIGAVTMAAYEMAFKLIGTLPDEGKQRDLYSAVGSSSSGGGGGGGNRRARSYVEYRTSISDDLPGRGPEEQSLFNEAHRGADGGGGGKRDHSPTEDERLHVLGDVDDDEPDGDARLSSLQQAGERASIWNRPNIGDYQTMTPPAELADDNSGGAADPKKAGSNGNGVTVQSKAVQYGDDESDVTESELGVGEVEEIQHGAHRLHRNPSYASTKRQSRAAATDHDGHPECGGSSTSAFAIHRDTSIPPPLPFGLHANLMTSGIGLVTLCCLWIGLPISHLLGWETFELPPNLWTVFSIGVVVTCGIFFNAAFMILLSLWGPVLASVSCLMTTVLVEIADVLLGRKLKLASVLGCTLVAAGFGVLVGGGEEGLH